MYSFSYLEPVCCSLSSSNCYFLTCIQISQEAGQVVWYSNLSQNFPQFIVIHTVKSFGIVNRSLGWINSILIFSSWPLNENDTHAIPPRAYSGVYEFLALIPLWMPASKNYWKVYLMTINIKKNMLKLYMKMISLNFSLLDKDGSLDTRWCK